MKLPALRLRWLPLWLLMLGIAPALNFAGDYLDGYFLNPDSGLLFGIFAMLILPWVIAFLFCKIFRAHWAVRVVLFAFAIVAQPWIFFHFTPPGATAEMWGIAARYSRDFPPQELRACANDLLKKRRDGTLAVVDWDRSHHGVVSDSAVKVSESELPAALRGRFKGVFIEDHGDDGETVLFATTGASGVACATKQPAEDYFSCKIGEGVYAYRYERL